MNYVGGVTACLLPFLSALKSEDRNAKYQIAVCLDPSNRRILECRPLFTAGIRGTLFKHGKLTTRTSHFLAKFRPGSPNTRRAGTKPPLRPKRTQTIKTTETAKPTPNANQQFGQTKPPRTRNSDSQRRRARLEKAPFGRESTGATGGKERSGSAR